VITDIVYEPYKQLVIKEYSEYPSPEGLVESLMAAPGVTARLLWANGVLFTPILFPPATEVLSKAFLEGKIYWSSVSFALMPDYSATVKTHRGPEVDVVDVTPNDVLREAAAWLKARSKRAKTHGSPSKPHRGSPETAR